MTLNKIKITNFLMPRDFHLDFHPPTAVKIHLISENVRSVITVSSIICLFNLLISIL